MPKSLNGLLFTAQFFAADGAVDDFVIRAGRGAGSSRFILANGRAFGMAERGDLLIRCVITTRAGVVGIPTDLGTRRGLSLMVLQIVAECRSKLFAANHANLRSGARCGRASDMTNRLNSVNLCHRLGKCICDRFKIGCGRDLFLCGFYFRIDLAAMIRLFFRRKVR